MSARHEGYTEGPLLVRHRTSTSYVIVHDCGVEAASEYYYLGRMARRNEAFIPLRRLNE
jgi:hypothetical protein